MSSQVCLHQSEVVQLAEIFLLWQWRSSFLRDWTAPLLDVCPKASREKNLTDPSSPVVIISALLWLGSTDPEVTGALAWLGNVCCEKIKIKIDKWHLKVSKSRRCYQIKWSQVFEVVSISCVLQGKQTDEWRGGKREKWTKKKQTNKDLRVRFNCEECNLAIVGRSDQAVHSRELPAAKGREGGRGPQTKPSNTERIFTKKLTQKSVTDPTCPTVTTLLALNPRSTACPFSGYDSWGVFHRHTWFICQNCPTAKKISLSSWDTTSVVRAFSIILFNFMNIQGQVFKDPLRQVIPKILWNFQFLRETFHNPKSRRRKKKARILTEFSPSYSVEMKCPVGRVEPRMWGGGNHRTFLTLWPTKLERWIAPNWTNLQA